VKLFHPDRNAQLAAFDRDIKTRLESIFAALTKAYGVLGHPGERAAYDQKLARQDQATARPAPAAPSRPVVFEPRPPKGAPARPPTPNERPVRPESEPAQPKRAASPPIPIVPPLPRKAPSPPRNPVASAAPSPPPQAPFRAQTPVTAPPAPPPIAPEQLVEHGKAYAETGDHERALQAFQRAVLLLPSDAEVHAALGRALFNLHGLTRQSEAALRKAIELDPGTAELYVELAAMYRSADRDDDARAALKRALMLDPLNVEARAALTALGVRISDPSDGFFRRYFKK
jgi:tetratricopeptide (TPR) repeat protein